MVFRHGEGCRLKSGAHPSIIRIRDASNGCGGKVTGVIAHWTDGGTRLCRSPGAALGGLLPALNQPARVLKSEYTILAGECVQLCLRAGVREPQHKDARQEHPLHGQSLHRTRRGEEILFVSSGGVGREQTVR